MNGQLPLDIDQATVTTRPRDAMANEETAQAIAREYWWPMRENHGTLDDAMQAVSARLTEKGVTLPPNGLHSAVLHGLAWAWARVAWKQGGYDVPSVARMLINMMRRVGCRLPEETALQTAVDALTCHEQNPQ